MTRTLAVLAFLVLAAAAAGCGDGDTTAPAATTTAAPTTAPPAATGTPATTTPAVVPVGGLRAQTCQDFLPMLDELRKHDPDAARTTAETAVTNLPSTPEWAGLSQADRAATIAGIRDAAAGTCQ